MNFLNLRVAQFLYRIVLLPSFVVHIAHILFVSANPKMLRIYAKSHIARMANTFAFWNFPLENHESGAMRKIGFPSILNLAVLTVALTGINNATVRLWSASIFESFFERFNQWFYPLPERFGCAFFTAEFLPFSVCGRCVTDKSRIASRTNQVKYRHAPIISQQYNGGVNGLADRQALWETCKAALCSS
jgi:hypothetical protein